MFCFINANFEDVAFFRTSLSECWFHIAWCLRFFWMILSVVVIKLFNCISFRILKNKIFFSCPMQINFSILCNDNLHTKCLNSFLGYVQKVLLKWREELLHDGYNKRYHLCNFSTECIGIAFVYMLVSMFFSFPHLETSLIAAKCSSMTCLLAANSNTWGHLQIWYNIFLPSMWSVPTKIRITGSPDYPNYLYQELAGRAFNKITQFTEMKQIIF